MSKLKELIHEYHSNRVQFFKQKQAPRDKIDKIIEEIKGNV